MGQGLESYDNGTKRNWRGWQWNRIVERLSAPVEDATVLYLCGPDDFDREKALDRGFRNENLVAVDVVEENVQKVRDGGGIAVCHDLHDILTSWPPDWPLHVVVADFCGGLDQGLTFAHTIAFSPALHHKALPVISVNMQRGRDTNGRAGGAASAMLGAHRDLDNGGVGGAINPAKHRGWILAMAVQRGILTMQFGGEPSTPEWAFRAQTALMDWVLTTYRGDRVYMDSAVFRWTPPNACLEMRSGALGGNRTDGSQIARRKIAAARALRTMKARAS